MSTPLITAYREAELLTARLGTWLLVEISTTQDLDQFLGFVSYVAEGMAHTKAKAPESRRQQISEAMTLWRRAARFIAGLDRERYQAIADSFLRRIKESAKRRRAPLPYVVAGAGHPWLTTKDAAPRRAGRQPIKPKPEARSECHHCGGFGYS